MTYEVLDIFCGVGGTTEGANRVPGVEVKIAMNHWELAIATHAANHPHADHVIADISRSDPRHYPRTDFLLASPECTNHTGAKGKKRKGLGQMDLWGNHKIDPAEERSRATMWDVVRFAEHHRYQNVVVENVVEAYDWTLYPSWIDAMNRLGYDHKPVFLNSQFAGNVPQSRDRMYVVFWQRNQKAPNLEFTPLAYCPKCDADVHAVQVWKKQHYGCYREQYTYNCPKGHGALKPYAKPAKDIIDWSNLGTRIGDRKKPLAAATIARIQKGLDRFFGEPFVMRNYTPGVVSSVDEPIGTVTTQDHHSLVAPFVMSYYSREDASSSIHAPVPTVVTEPRHALVSYIMTYYGNGGVSSIDAPCPTVTTKAHHALVSSETPKVEDCYLRMFTIDELRRAMGFPDGYILMGTQHEKNTMLGNAVTPPAMEQIVTRLVEALN